MDEGNNTPGGGSRLRRSGTISMMFCCCLGGDDTERTLLRPSWLQKVRRQSSQPSNEAPGSEEGSHNWWKKGWNSMRRAGEWSENAFEDASCSCCSGPKWRHFVRRFKSQGRTIYHSRPARFQYDPLSYELNFDDGDRPLPLPTDEDTQRLHHHR